MNNIKYRVWDNYKKIFVTDYVGIRPDGHIVIYNIWYDDSEATNYCDESWTDIDDKNRYEIQQFTGCQDIDKKDIYEGDILSSEVNEKPCNYIVKWGGDYHDYVGFMLNPVMKNPPRITYHIHDFKIWMAEGFRIIGNIFENPELLKS